MIGQSQYSQAQLFLGNNSLQNKQLISRGSFSNRLDSLLQPQCLVNQNQKSYQSTIEFIKSQIAYLDICFGHNFKEVHRAHNCFKITF